MQLIKLTHAANANFNMVFKPYIYNIIREIKLDCQCISIQNYFIFETLACDLLCNYCVLLY